MAKFSKAELDLMRKLQNDRLITSVHAIREAVEDIWSSDAPRIIQDYTDHGIAHIERVASNASRLLSSGTTELSDEELYVLMAGILLHDIGMQCDVVVHSHIADRAQVNAEFSKIVTASKSSGYSVPEQQLIRKWHSLLSAAWIDEAARSGETVLGRAAKTIPEHLVEDIMDVCRFHTKLPIRDCPVSFRFRAEGRKQLVAAILRFADELDIDSRRVSLETIYTYALNPHNALYWWLHSRTIISYPSPNTLEMVIRTSPQDNAKYGDLLMRVYLGEFQVKNRPVVSILAQGGFPIVYSDKCGIESDERAEPFPPKVIESLRLMEKPISPLTQFVREVQTWLRAVQYEITDMVRIDDRVVEMMATMTHGPIRQAVRVWCVGGEITAGDVENLNQRLDLRCPQGWLICDRRISPAAITASGNTDTVSVFSLGEFLRHKIWGPYFDTLTIMIKDSRIDDFYVDIGGYKSHCDEQGVETSREDYESLDVFVDDWLKERGKTHISLLGEFGSGKTWFCRHYAFRQLQRYVADPVNERFPLLVTLRHFSKATTVPQLINDTLLEHYRLALVGSAFEVFDELNRQGKLLVILDGFDEMARKVDYQTVVDNFWELAKMVYENSKVILTSRSEYFRMSKESEVILSGGEFGRRQIQLDPPKFEVLYLQKLSPQQIARVIRNRLGEEKGDRAAKKILQIPRLAEMASKPVLIELLLAALDEVSVDDLHDQTKVYEYACDRLLLRNILTERTFTSTEDKVVFLCELAWEMVTSGSLLIHYTAFPSRIRTYFGDRVKDQHELDTWDYDLRSQTLLHRNAAGYYEFAHKSLAEYFASRRLVKQLRDGDYSGIGHLVPTLSAFDGLIQFIRDMIDSQTIAAIKTMLFEGIGQLRQSNPGSVYNRAASSVSISLVTSSSDEPDAEALDRNVVMSYGGIPPEDLPVDLWTLAVICMNVVLHGLDLRYLVEQKITLTPHGVMYEDRQLQIILEGLDALDRQKETQPK